MKRKLVKRRRIFWRVIWEDGSYTIAWEFPTKRGAQTHAQMGRGQAVKVTEYWEEKRK